MHCNCFTHVYQYDDSYNVSVAPYFSQKQNILVQNPKTPSSAEGLTSLLQAFTRLTPFLKISEEHTNINNNTLQGRRHM